MNARLTVTAGAATAAASVALHPLIIGASWFWAGLGAIITVGCAGALTRLRRLPVIVCLPAAVCGLLLYVNAAFSGHRSLIGLVPTRASLLDLLHLAAQGYAEASRFAPPVPALRGIMLLAVTGIGGAAVLTDLIAVRLRRTAAAGLPLLALFSVTVATHASQSRLAQALVFCAGVAGYLMLLAADGRERISAWGRLVAFPALGRAGHAAAGRPARDPAEPAGPGSQTGWPPGPAGREPPAGPGRASLPDTRSLAAAGRRVGLAAVAVALIVPLFIPGLRVRGLPGGGGPGSGAGNGLTLPASLPDPVARLYGQLIESRAQNVLTYRTDDPEPPYLRQYVLNLYSDGWHLAFSGRTAPASGRLPAPPGLQSARAQTVHTTLKFTRSIISRGQNFLPVPYPPARISIGHGWRVDPRTLMVESQSNQVAGLGYEVTSKEVAPTVSQLRDAPAPPDSVALAYLNLPATYIPYLSRLRAVAKQAAKGARTPFDEAVALQQWFTETGGFSYSLSSRVPDSPAGLQEFLTTTKSGYCQQFAIAMAVLARVLGIPSRVAVGYTAGTNEGGSNFQVTTSDAHAWPELYFQGTGWLRFEPTPAGDAPGQGTATPPVYTLPPSSGGSGGAVPSGTLGGAGAQPSGGGAGGSAGLHHPTGALGTAGSGGHPQPRRTPPWALIAGIVILVALAAPSVGRLLVRRWRWLTAAGDSGRARAAWLELRDTLADFGLTAAASESPRAVARRLEERLPEAAQPALARIALAEERCRYATSPAGSGTLRTDSQAVRRAVAAAAGRRARLRARVFPVSVLAPLGRAGRHAVDVFGWIEYGVARLLARLLRRVTSAEPVASDR